MTAIYPTTVALEVLHVCRQNLRAARADALAAAPKLYGTRATRAAELAEKLADCQDYVERLAFVVEADIRYEEVS